MQCYTSFLKSNITFLGNRAINRGGSIGSHNSDLYFMGSIHFDSNSADYGGAIILRQNSRVNFESPLTLWYTRNVANKKGGAIYYDTGSIICYSEHLKKCFLTFDSLDNVSLTFANNSAYLAGAVIYSGQLDSCGNYLGNTNSACAIINGQNRINKKKLFEFLLKVSNITCYSDKQECFSADIESIQFCCGKNVCINNSVAVTIYPGQHFKIVLIASSFYSSSESTTEIFHKIESPIHAIKVKLVSVNDTRVNHSCTSVYYYLKATDTKNQSNVSFSLYHENPCSNRYDLITLSIHIKPCPLGFQLLGENNYKVCLCDERLQTFTQKCDINKLSIEWKNTFWVSKQANDSGLILHKGCCPFDFCKDKLVNITLNESNRQCNFNRNGTLCGQCREQCSLALGTLHCLYCVKSSYISLVILFALAGIALVIGFLVLHMTVDVGTLNGLIFYANIVHSNREAYFQHTREITNFHAIFISWLNLDFGIETCFYDGMDIYGYSFYFPSTFGF